MSGKGLLAIGLAVIAAVFLALVIQARSDQGASRRADDAEALAKFDTCDTAVRRALDTAGDHLEEMFGAGARADVREVAERRCREDAWPSEVTSCLDGAQDASMLSRCIGKLDPDAHEKLMADLERIPRTDSDPPDVPVDAAIDGEDLVAADDGPPACIEYGRMIDRMSKCDKLPEATRTALTDAYAQVRQSWKNIPRDAWESLDGGCKQAVEAMQQALSTICP